MSLLRGVLWNGLWKQNTALVQLLGMCPLLAMSNTIVNGIGLGLATVFVMAMSNLGVSALRALIPYEVRIPIFILIIAALVTIVDLAMNAWLHQLYLVLGIFIPLIVTNCLVLARVEAYAAKNGVLASTVDGAAMGFGLTWVLGVLGAIREFIGTGAILTGIDMVIPGAQPIQILPQDYPGFLPAILPPGAFFILGLLIAGRNWHDARAARRAAQASAAPAAGAQAGA